MFTRLVRESLIRNPRRKILTAAALMLGMAVATATLTVALEVGDRMARRIMPNGGREIEEIYGLRTLLPAPEIAARLAFRLAKLDA